MATERRKCKRCKKDLIFVKAPDGKIHPLDPVPPTFIVERDTMGEEVAIRSDALVSHFATCPFANEFSASRKT